LIVGLGAVLRSNQITGAVIAAFRSWVLDAVDLGFEVGRAHSARRLALAVDKHFSLGAALVPPNFIFTVRALAVRVGPGAFRSLDEIALALFALAAINFVLGAFAAGVELVGGSAIVARLGGTLELESHRVTQKAISYVIDSHGLDLRVCARATNIFAAVACFASGEPVRSVPGIVQLVLRAILKLDVVNFVIHGAVHVVARVFVELSGVDNAITGAGSHHWPFVSVLVEGTLEIDVLR